MSLGVDHTRRLCLDIIFNFLDRDASVANAYVCKRCSEIPRRRLERDQRPPPLKPIVHQENTFECVSSIPSASLAPDSPCP